MRYIEIQMLRLSNMDHSFLILRLGKQIREKRLNRGFTQAKLAELAGLTRQKVIGVEKGDLSVSMMAYARVAGALDCEFAIVPAAMPTLEELEDLF
jgi:HTH-type transcriptional regulator/antitoxin HipB